MKVQQIDSFQAFGERKFGEIIDQLTLLIVSTNPDGFSLAIHQTFPLYGMLFMLPIMLVLCSNLNNIDVKVLCSVRVFTI